METWIEQCGWCGEDVEVDTEYDVITCDKTECVTKEQKSQGGVN